MSFGHRKSERVHFQHDRVVNLMGIDGTWRRPCVLNDVSASGARLEVEGPTDVLKSREFFWCFRQLASPFGCELVWINGSAVGVQFVLNGGKKKKEKPVKPEPVS